MLMFSYRAMDAEGRIFNGEMEANHLLDLESRLRHQKLDLIHGKQQKGRFFGFGKSKPGRKDLINFCFYLEQLLSAGVPLIDALKDLRDSLGRDSFQETVASIVEKIEGGEVFSQAISHFPKVFSESFISLVKAGEESGQIEAVLADLTESLKWQDEIAAQSKKALMYPAVTALVVVCVVFFLMIYLVPQLTEFITSMEGELPFYTLALIATSNFFVTYWYVIVLLPVVSFAAVKLAARQSSRFRLGFDRFKLNIPVLGPIFKKLILARFANYFALQYAAGIALLRSLEICEKIVHNTYMERALVTASQLIVGGASIHQSLQQTGIFPPLVVRMIRVGEQGGDLEKSLLNVSYFYKREVDESVEKLQSMIEPTMTVVMGAIIAWIMLAVMGPIYDLMTTLDI